LGGWAFIGAGTRRAAERPRDAEMAVDEHLWLAAVLGLGVRWIDLMVARADVLLALGNVDEARRCAETALHGQPEEALPGALDDRTRYRMGAGAAVAALRAAGGEPEPQVIEVIAAQAPVVRAQPTTRTRPDPPDPRVIYAAPEDRQVDLDDAARRVIEDYAQRGIPFVLYLRTFGMTVFHGPMEFGPQLLENSLRAALPEGVNIITVQDRRHGLYSGTGSASDRGAPALILSDGEWRDVVEELIRHAALIVSECLLLTWGVRYELETAYRLGRWDRTVLVLPPVDGNIEIVDSDPLIQMFPRCVWANAFHTRPLIDQYAITDLVSRIREILELPESERRDLVDQGTVDERYQVSLMPLAKAYENNVTIDLAFRDQDDEKVRYEAFWKLFRACSIRGVAWSKGDHSEGNLLAMADNYVHMSTAMLEARVEDGRAVILGDMAFAEQCAVSACALLADQPALLREVAQRQMADVQRLRHAMETDPDRFLLRPRYGPFLVRQADINPE
jgi:hypothetical protein